MISEGFYDKKNWLIDAKTFVEGLEIFCTWFVERKLETPLNNKWEFDIAKLIIPRVFIDDELLVVMSKKYAPITRIVKNHVGDNLFRVSPELIGEVVKLNLNHGVHEKIDMEDL